MGEESFCQTIGGNIANRQKKTCLLLGCIEETALEVSGLVARLEKNQNYFKYVGKIYTAASSASPFSSQHLVV